MHVFEFCTLSEPVCILVCSEGKGWSRREEQVHFIVQTVEREKRTGN